LKTKIRIKEGNVLKGYLVRKAWQNQSRASTQGNVDNEKLRSKGVGNVLSEGEGWEQI